MPANPSVLPFPSLDGLTTDQRSALSTPFRVVPGYGMRVLRSADRQSLIEASPDGLIYDNLQVWEPPRKGHLYVISVDVSNGMGLDNSVIDVTRVGTLREPDEQVAQFVTSRIEPDDLSYYIDPVGRLYTGRDGLPALVAIECNGLGLGTQSELQKHLGYPNLFIWQVLDTIHQADAYTRRYGWWTSNRSRPLILGRYYHAVKTVDPRTGWPDYRVNSPHTLREWATFVSPGPIWMGEAAEGAHDDCVMAGAIGVHVAATLQESYRETTADARKRLAEESARIDERRKIGQSGLSAQNTDVTYGQLYGVEDLYENVDPHADPMDPHQL